MKDINPLSVASKVTSLTPCRIDLFLAVLQGLGKLQPIRQSKQIKIGIQLCNSLVSKYVIENVARCAREQLEDKKEAKTMHFNKCLY